MLSCWTVGREGRAKVERSDEVGYFPAHLSVRWHPYTALYIQLSAANAMLPVLLLFFSVMRVTPPPHVCIARSPRLAPLVVDSTCRCVFLLLLLLLFRLFFFFQSKTDFTATYRLLEGCRLGEGSYASVFLAEHLKVRRREGGVPCA